MVTNGLLEMGDKFPNGKYSTPFENDKGDQGTIRKDFDHTNLGQGKKGVKI
jgi:hypothetical protein